MIALFAAVVLISSLFGWHKFSRRKRVVARLNERLPNVRETSIESIVKSEGKSGHLSQITIRFDALFSRKDKIALSGMLLTIPFAVRLFLADIPLSWQAATGLLAALLVAVPYYLLLKKRQSEAFEKGIVQVLGLVSRAVSAGLSVPQAIEQVANNQNDLLGQEFARIHNHISVGMSLRKTLEDACVRLPYPTFRYFSVALLLNQSNGGQLREILHNLSRTMHDNRAMRKKVKSLTSEPRMTAAFLSFLPMLILAAVAWIAPSMFELLIHSESGQTVLIYCGGSIVTGALILHSMTRNRNFS